MGKRLLALCVVAVAVSAVWSVSNAPQGAPRAARSASAPGAGRAGHATPNRRLPAARQLVAARESIPGQLEAEDAERAEAASSRVLVFVDGVPAAVGWIDAWEHTERWQSSEELRARAPVSRPVGPDGSAAFPSPWEFGAAVEVRMPGGRPLSQTMSERAASPSGPVRTHDVHLGTALVAGRVWDRDGRPAAGVLVSGSFGGRLHGKTHADSAGCFEFTDLPAGDYRLHAEPDGAQLASRHGELAAGEHVELELGSPQGLRAIAGRVIDAFGEPLENVRPEPLGRLWFTRWDVEPSQYTSAVLEADGSFEVDLAEGAYSVSFSMAASGTSRRPLASSFVVSESGARELVLPGSRVSGFVHLADSGKRFDPQHDGWASLSLTEDVPDGLGSRQAVNVGLDGRYVFHGVTPGHWTLRGERLVGNAPTIVAGSEPRRIEVDLVVLEDADG